MIRSVLSLVLVLCPVLAAAGPWPREESGFFLSATIERNRADQSYASLYAEYGWRPRTTLGLELGRADQGETSAILWVQRALDDGQGANRVAAQAGAGVIRRDGDLVPVVQSALSWGRGFERWGGGWMTAQVLGKMTGSSPDPRQPDQASSFATSFLTAERTVKADLTLGLRPRPGLMVINSLWLEDRQDEAFSAKLASSLVFDVPGPAQIELGLVEPLDGPAERAIRLGSWIEF